METFKFPISNGMKQTIRKPLVSEKSISQSESGKYVFVVSLDSNKTSVKNGVESLFKVKVTDVHMMAFKGKVKSFRRVSGKRPDYKKAIVTLKKGDKIDLFEGAK